MPKHKVITNKEEGLKRLAFDHLKEMENVNLIGKFEVINHASILEWEFGTAKDAVFAANYLANHFEFCQMR